MGLVKKYLYPGAVAALSLLLLTQLWGLWLNVSRPVSVSVGQEPAEKPLTWVEFNIPARALERAMRLDIDTWSKEDAAHVDWVELLAVLGTKYGGSWSRYKAADLDAAARRLQDGEAPEEILEGYTNYYYYYRAYSAVLGGFLGSYIKEVPLSGSPDIRMLQERYGLKVYFPLAEGYGYSHYDDFGSSRSYGYNRRHLGHDLTGTMGTPVIAVEAGTVEELGWNQYGGWRIGIRSFDGLRYYYYAHLRKDRPYAQGLEQGARVQAGDVIGYMGMTGYSAKENVNGMKFPHLHFGIQLIFDESQKDGVNQIWIDVYALINLLESNRATVERDEESKEYYRKYYMYDEAFPLPE